MENKGGGDNNKNNLQRLRQMTERVENQTSGNPQYYIINKISQNTEKILRNLRRLAVAQTLEKNHQLTLERKISRSNIIMIH